MHGTFTRGADICSRISSGGTTLHYSEWQVQQLPTDVFTEGIHRAIRDADSSFGQQLCIFRRRLPGFLNMLIDIKTENQYTVRRSYKPFFRQNTPCQVLSKTFWREMIIGPHRHEETPRPPPAAPFFSFFLSFCLYLAV